VQCARAACSASLAQVVTPRTDFFVTASLDGHLKFWKKAAEGVEFVKHYRSHSGAVLDLAGAPPAAAHRPR